jgi:hypothetical protein
VPAGSSIAPPSHFRKEAESLVDNFLSHLLELELEQKEDSIKAGKTKSKFIISFKEIGKIWTDSKQMSRPEIACHMKNYFRKYYRHTLIFIEPILSRPIMMANWTPFTINDFP